jgi:regulator of sigma E protease
MMSIIITILLLGLIILLHEFGHFITAKAFKMPVIEFAIGMGPKLISIKKGETNYSIRALPLGGFVNIDGMQIEDDPSKVVKNGFNSQSPVKRFVVLVAGVVMNFLSAILVIYVLVLGFKEVPSRFIPTIVNESI